MTTTIPLSFEARNSLPASNELTPATHYLVLESDGTRTLYLSDADAPYTLRRVLGGLLVPAALSRTGALTSRLTKSGASLLGQTITNNTGAPITITSVTVERVTLSAGTATLSIRQGNGGTILATAPATAQDGGLTGALTYTLAPGASVMAILQATGGTLTAQLSSGHTWQGLTVGSALITGFTGGTGGAVAEDNGAPAAQLAFQFGAGGTAVRRVEVAAPLGGRVNGDTLTIGLGSGGTPATLDRGNATVQATAYAASAWAWTITVDQPITLTGLTLLLGLDAGDAPKAGIWLDATGELLTPDSTVATVAVPTSTFAPSTLQPGTPYRIGWHGPSTGNSLPSAYSAPTWTGITFEIGSYTGAGPDVMPNTAVLAGYGWPSFDLIGYYGEQNRLDQSYVLNLQRDLANHDSRITALEARPLIDTEAIQDIVGAMIPGATYNDATGTITLPPDQTLTPEQVQDIVGAFTQAGANATVVYDDTANTLTISSTGSTTGNSAGGVNRGAWAASTAYNANDIVSYSGAMYYAKAAFTSGSSFSAANWTAWPDQVGSVGSTLRATVNASPPANPTVGDLWKIPGSYLCTCVSVSPTKWEDATGVDRTPAATTTYRYYRLNVTANNGADRQGTAELMLRTTSGGTNIALNKPVLTNGETSYDAYLTDGITNGGSNFNGTFSTSLPNTLRVDLGSAQIVAEYVVYSYGFNAGADIRSFRDWTFEGSNDGSSWTVLQTVTNQTSWTFGQARTFTL